MVELLQLEVNGFGKFASSRVINFKKGLNFITGLNETGKSTVLEGILASLFKYSTTNIDSFLSWKNKDVCRVALTYKTDKGETFKVTSDYKSGRRKLEKIVKGKSSEVTSVATAVKELVRKHFGFDEQKVFENTSFIRQSQMSILGDKAIKNKIRDMVEEVFAGTAEASATKALKKIEKVKKDSLKEVGILGESLYELKKEYSEAEETSEGVDKDAKTLEDVNENLTKKSDKLKKLEENKKEFDEKEELLKQRKNIEEKIEGVNETLDTLKKTGTEKVEPKNKKVLGVVLILVGLVLAFGVNPILGAVISIVGIGLFFMKESATVKKSDDTDIKKFEKKKEGLIDDKAEVNSALKKYKLVNFNINDFKDLEKLKNEVDELKEKKVELRTSVTKTKELVKSPEEIKEELDSTEEKINELKEKAEEYDLAHTFLQKAETGVQQKFTPSIEKNSKPILKEITNEKYSDLKIDDESLDITVKAPEIKDYVEVDTLSQGAKDQLYFAVRTTMSDLLSGNINIPLIFDDPFHNFDDPRLKKTISAIKKIAKNKQVILISHRAYQKEFKNFEDNLIEMK